MVQKNPRLTRFSDGFFLHSKTRFTAVSVQYNTAASFILIPDYHGSSAEYPVAREARSYGALPS